ncbi:MAG: hypothetical protein FWG28_08595 [Clostridiales bacterium]|nr:hypothetical protein [Clostridiales bacterium]
MEAELRYELERAVPELEGEVYPTNAPKSAARSFLVYVRTGTDLVKTLDGYTGKRAIRFILSVMAKQYLEMKELMAKVEACLLSMEKARIGEGGGMFVDEVTINDVNEVYENDLKLNRGIIEVTIYC